MKAKLSNICEIRNIFTQKNGMKPDNHGSMARFSAFRYRLPLSAHNKIICSPKPLPYN